MKKFINSKTISYLVILGSIIGLALRLWTIGDGPDAFGLYPSRPLAWGLLWLCSAAVAAMIIVANRPLKNVGSYDDNYPKSVPGFLGHMAAGIAMVLCGIQQFTGTRVELGVIDLIFGILSLVAGAAMVLLGVYRLMGKKPNFLLHGVICLFFALRLFARCRIWSNEPQMGVIVLPFLASLVLMLASYQRTCFDVELGNRRHSLLWSLMGTYLCILAILSFQEVLFYGACALWLMTDLCSLRPLKQKKAPQIVQEPEEPEENTVPRSPEEMTMEELEDWLENPGQKEQ